MLDAQSDTSAEPQPAPAEPELNKRWVRIVDLASRAAGADSDRHQ
jgi:hypothetical protein